MLDRSQRTENRRRKASRFRLQATGFKLSRPAPFRNFKFLTEPAVRSLWLFLACSLLLAAWGGQSAFADEGNIDSTNKYAWSENAGWQNYRPKDAGCDVYNTYLEGDIWSENAGWVRLKGTANDSTAYGVTNDENGNLSGYARSENAGWINFDSSHSQVTINASTGEFDGYAWSENLGWVHFSNASLVYNVQTSWPIMLLKIKKDANKKEVVIGDVVTYTVTIKNETASDVTNVYLEDKIPAGFKYINGKAILDNVQIADPTGNRPITFNIGTVSAGTTRTLKYQLVVGSGVTFGNYENSCHAKYSDGTTISNNGTETVKIVPDSLFDLGTVIGKVFWDKNENGVQDLPSSYTKVSEGKQTKRGKVIIEEPIPNVQIVIEDGTIITTDKDGKYHLQAIIPGRHLFRLDERTLPEGAYLTTDKVVIVDITPGILAKVNFGVKLKEGTALKVMPFSITQDKGIPKSRLNVSLFQPENREQMTENGNQYEFRIFTNYSLFIDKWKLEILNKDTKALVKRFEGSGLTINEPILWDPIRDKYLTGQVERDYIYKLTVTGKNGRQDVTKERRLVVREQKVWDLGGKSLASYGAGREQKTEKEIEKEKQEWIKQESNVNNLDRQNIRIDGETILVHIPLDVRCPTRDTLDEKSSASSTQHPASNKVYNIRIVKGGKLEGEIPIVRQEGLTAKELLEKPKLQDKSQEEQTTDIIIPKGEYDIEVINSVIASPSEVKAKQSQKIASVAPAGLSRNDRQAEGKTYTQHIKVGEDYLFFVAMGDAKAGYTFNRGNIEPVQQDSKFKKGFWSEGKLAYYLKGKIKGKYLITSSLDTERDKKELFRNLDPDKFYPVYGDTSTVDYNATNTQGALYLLVEWDKSSILWGNYNTQMTDTEFTQFSRTLYGGKIHYESLSATQFGEPHTKLIVFRARAQQRAAHNEFVGTGGSLFYLKNKDVTEGSDKVKIEVRDKITGLVLVSKDMEEGVDYQIDYSEGRIIFWEPVSQTTESNSIISSQLLDGNPLYVVVDYEYQLKDKYNEGSTGIRLQQSLTDYLRVGGTYVQEEQLDKNYELKGIDVILHLGKDATLTGEYAESKSEQVGSFISTDGGLSFTELATGDLDKGRAYGLKGEAHLFDKLGLMGYYKRIGKGFSSSATSSQQGKELMGAGVTLDITPKTRLRATHDIQKLIDEGNSQTQLQVGAQKTETTSVQLRQEIVTDKLKLTAEYRRQQVKEKKEEFESEPNTETDVLAIKADYQATEKTSFSLEQQATLKGDSNQQTTLGVVNNPNEWLSLRGKETVGNQGAATTVGVSASVKDRFELSGDITRANASTGEINDTVSLGGRAKVDDKTEVYTTYAVTDSSFGDKAEQAVYGAKRKLNDGLELSMDKSYAKGSTETSSTNIFGLSGDINDKWAASGSFERGIVQNHDGTRATRNAGSIGLGFVDKDSETGEARLKASSKLELRLDKGDVDKKQYLAYNAVEGKINPNTTIFAKANISQTKNTTTGSTEAQYKELVTGAAYRPVNFDRLNLIGKYTYLEDNSPSGQSDFSNIEKEKSHTLSGEAVYDLTDKWQIAEKLAYKQGEEKVTGFDFTKTQTWLMVHRLNYNFARD